MGVSFSCQKLNLEISEKNVIFAGKEFHGKVETFANAAIRNADLKIVVCGELCLNQTNQKNGQLIVEKKQILNQQHILVSKNDVLERGRQEHTFSVKLPEELPPSINFQGDHGESLKIRYFVKAKLQMSNWFLKTVKDFIVFAASPQLDEHQLKQQREIYQATLPQNSLHKFPVDAQLCSERVKYGDAVKIYVNIHNFPFTMCPDGVVNLLERVTLNVPTGKKCFQRRYCFHNVPETLQPGKPIELNYQIQVEDHKQDQSYASEFLKMEHFVELKLLKNQADNQSQLTGHKLQLPIVILPQLNKHS
eukprot:TRINITY_DN1681_c0_g2_i2.p1 TRINITY_DN1681_c0_g2~~TRINITY_DN1681_c0_g2_i2.p1  ORF type:complete len:306 (+),score=30.29 TRINITY_DN1681_c0_g2_i2:77-994(+)